MADSKKPSEVPKATDPVSKRMKVAEILVAQEKQDGFCKGTDEDMDSMLLYLDDCAAVDDIDDVLDAIINNDRPSGSQAA